MLPFSQVINRCHQKVSCYLPKFKIIFLKNKIFFIFWLGNYNIPNYFNFYNLVSGFSVFNRNIICVSYLLMIFILMISAFFFKKILFRIYK